ncbi:MAG TPA: cytochrome c [Casimicrobiaceae bacterium]|nr:cytochrome c [Casimicrobiaceae bacterium]
MNKHVAPVATALAIVGAFSLAVHAQDVKPDRAIKYRQGIMTAQGWQIGILGAMAKGDRPYDKDIALRSANHLDQLVYMAWEGFTPGSDQGAPTKAKAEIWKDPAKFKKLQETLQAETPKLVAAAKSGDVAQLRPAVGAVGKVCNDCHDEFRSK